MSYRLLVTSKVKLLFSIAYSASMIWSVEGLGDVSRCLLHLVVTNTFVRGHHGILVMQSAHRLCSLDPWQFVLLTLLSCLWVVRSTPVVMIGVRKLCHASIRLYFLSLSSSHGISQLILLLNRWVDDLWVGKALLRIIRTVSWWDTRIGTAVADLHVLKHLWTYWSACVKLFHVVSMSSSLVGRYLFAMLWEVRHSLQVLVWISFHFSVDI